MDNCEIFFQPLSREGNLFFDQEQKYFQEKYFDGFSQQDLKIWVRQQKIWFEKFSF